MIDGGWWRELETRHHVKSANQWSAENRWFSLDTPVPPGKVDRVGQICCCIDPALVAKLKKLHACDERKGKYRISVCQ